MDYIDIRWGRTGTGSDVLKREPVIVLTEFRGKQFVFIFFGIHRFEPVRNFC